MGRYAVVFNVLFFSEVSFHHPERVLIPGLSLLASLLYAALALAFYLELL